MTWAEHHTMSERYASEAEVAARAGAVREAEALYQRAADAERCALDDLDPSKRRTAGITAVSAVALYYKARDYDAAAQLAHARLAGDALPAFAVEQLRELLGNIWARQDQERTGLRFLQGDVLVSVQGGPVVRGGAPLDLIVGKVKEVQALFFRTVEMLLELPLRRRGEPSPDVQAFCRPWLFQAPPGSYQFAVRVQEPEQGELFTGHRPQVEQVATAFLDIVRASATDPEEALPAVVPSPEYREAFLKLTRNLAPTGRSYERIQIRDAGRPEVAPITMIPGTRDAVNQALRRTQVPRKTGANGASERRLGGVLRAVHLDQDWLEIALDERNGEHARVEQAGDALDDVIGPMVNRRVLVDVLQTGKGFIFRDIQLED